MIEFGWRCGSPAWCRGSGSGPSCTRSPWSGQVGNDSAGVFIEVEGDRRAVKEFLAAVRDQAPPLATVDEVSTRELEPGGTAGFRIVASPPGGDAGTLVAADSATCADCLRELFDPADRRYRYPYHFAVDAHSETPRAGCATGNTVRTSPSP